MSVSASAIDAMTALDAGSPDFDSRLQALLDWSEVSDSALEHQVAAIIAAVRDLGDTALLDYSRHFDGAQADSVAGLEISGDALQAALQSLDTDLRAALELAAGRIRDYHERQLAQAPSWSYRDAGGNELGQRVRPITRAGLYVPGGKAAYPSSVLMTAIPARVAGVEELIMVSPAPDGTPNPAVLAAAAIAGVDRVFVIGGAQAIAALAFGTETIPRVDKIVGPGNKYVAEAKRQVFGRVGLDMIAGPSEVLIIADDSANPEWLAADLFSQAEHDENAQALLVSDSAALIGATRAAMARLLDGMPRADIIAASIASRGATIVCNDLAAAVAISNRVAPEHLQLAVADPDALLDDIGSAGAIFCGHYCPEAVGDYAAGPSHVLPTAGTARFSSPLGVYDFQTRSSLLRVGAAAQDIGNATTTIARSERLAAHALSAALRWPDKGDGDA